MPIDLNEDLSEIAVAQLGQCPCGENAVWYRIAPPLLNGDVVGDANTPTFGVRWLTGSDLTENLCDGCFADAVPESDHLLWKRVE
ncbi:MAG: hypothetical protein H8F28_13325 [Fibrella sp.]|nr:hypothetical protein [Armatimonadota bacterium]